MNMIMIINAHNAALASAYPLPCTLTIYGDIFIFVNTYLYFVIYYVVYSYTFPYTHGVLTIKYCKTQ